jgi:hypothetical protein
MENNKDKQSYGLESHFTEDVYFYKNIFIQSGSLSVPGISSFYGPTYFYNSVYIDGDLSAGIITARIRLDVGVGGTILTTSTGNIGIASTQPKQKLDVNGSVTVSERIGIGSANPQQRVDVAGSVKIDETIYDSVNTPGKNGYYMVRDIRGLRWIPLIAENCCNNDVLGIDTSGIFILDEGVPLYP